MIRRAGTLLASLVLLAAQAHAGDLSDDHRIHSEHLGYDLQYRVYTPGNMAPDRSYPLLLVTDGQFYLGTGGMDGVLDEMIDDGDIEPLIAVFVDSRNPDDLRENRRNREFMCNVDYVNFYTAELLPALYRDFPVYVDREQTHIMGLSFGGLNAACFGAVASNRFGNLAMLSPAADQHVKVVADLFDRNDTMPLNVFISAGTVGDNLRAARRLANVLEAKGNDVTFLVNRGKGHDWDNWGEVLDDALLTFFAPGEP